jgi:hypothetical protein
MWEGALEQRYLTVVWKQNVRQDTAPNATRSETYALQWSSISKVSSLSNKANQIMKLSVD